MGLPGLFGQSGSAHRRPVLAPAAADRLMIGRQRPAQRPAVCYCAYVSGAYCEVS